MNLNGHPKSGRQQEQLQLFRRVMTTMNNGLIIVRLGRDDAPKLDVLEINPAAMNMLGVASSDFALKELPEGSNELFDREHARQYAEVLRSGSERDLGELCRAGTTNQPNCFAVRALPLSDLHVGILLEDVTPLKEAEKAVSSLRSMCARVHSVLDANTLLDVLIQEAASVLHAESGVAGFCTSEGVSCFRYLAQGELVPPDRCRASGGELLCRMIAAETPYRITDATRDPRVDKEKAVAFGVRSAIGTPFLDERSEIVGFLELHNKIGAPGFDTMDEDQLAVIEQLASIAMRNSADYQKIAEMGRNLRESRERYQILIEGIDAIVWEADAVTHQFSFVSPQAEKVLGYPVEQWFKEPTFLIDKIHPDDREGAIFSRRRGMEKGEDYQLLYRALTADGRYIRVHESVKLISEPTGNKRLRGLMLDITNMVNLEELLRKSESRFRSTFESAGFGIALLDQEGSIIEINPALEQLLGYRETELRALGFFNLNHPEDLETDLQQFREVMNGKIDGYQMEKRFIHRDGRSIWVRLSVSLVRDGSGAPEYAIGMAEDITERKKSEVEIAELLAQVKQNAAELETRVAERTAQLEDTNAELKAFAYTVSHDLRAPLRAVQGYAEIIAAESTFSQEGRDALERILAAARRMDFLIQDLLAYSRLSMQDIVLTPVSLQKVVSDALAHLRLESEGKEFRIEVAQDLPEVQGHSAVLTQVVLNLLSNAIKFMSPNVIPQLQIWAADNGEFHRLFIKDNGIGISAEHQRRIFQIFERLHGTEVYPGTGVGLAIARKGVLRLGGRIGVESELGQGSVFWIDLPRAEHETNPGKRI